MKKKQTLWISEAVRFLIYQRWIVNQTVPVKCHIAIDKLSSCIIMHYARMSLCMCILSATDCHWRDACISHSHSHNGATVWLVQRVAWHSLQRGRKHTYTCTCTHSIQSLGLGLTVGWLGCSFLFCHSSFVIQRNMTVEKLGFFFPSPSLYWSFSHLLLLLPYGISPPIWIML